MNKPDRMTVATWKISSALLEVEDLESALTNTLDVLSEQLNAAGGAIWILDEATGIMHCVVSTGPLDLTGITFENGVGTEGLVVSTEKSAFFTETEKDEAGASFIAEDLRKAVQRLASRCRAGTSTLLFFWGFREDSSVKDDEPPLARRGRCSFF